VCAACCGVVFPQLDVQLCVTKVNLKHSLKNTNENFKDIIIGLRVTAFERAGFRRILDLISANTSGNVIFGTGSN